MKIHTAYIPGAIGSIAALHGQYYAKNWGFGVSFEALVAKGLSDFFLRLTDDDLVLIAEDDQGIVASLFIDMHDPEGPEDVARLRWFIVANRAKGSGIGRKLMARAVDHVDRLSEGKAWLTTFAGLDAARHLYEAYGFFLFAKTTVRHMAPRFRSKNSGAILKPSRHPNRHDYAYPRLLTKQPARVRSACRTTCETPNQNPLG